MTRWLYVSIALTLVALAGSLGVYFFAYDQLPDQVPTHWNIHGEPDAWTPKADVFWTFLLLPLVMAGMVLLTVLLPWLSPKQFEVDRFRDVYGYIMMLIVALFGYLHLVTLLASMQERIDLNRLLVGGILLFVALLGNVLGRVQRNFWIGVRTPWTLASERVWIDTHRLAAWLFVAAGLLGFVAVLLGAPLLWCFVGVILAALVPAIYSLVLYKRLAREGRI
jgi:uncharacterized membrane protein